MGCGGIIAVDEDDDNGEADEFFDEEERDNELDDLLGEVCEGDGYTVYTYGDEECPDENTFLPMEGEETVSASNEPVDILFVLNTSASMNYYLKTGFEQRFTNFIPSIEGLDWRILFTNAGVSSGGFFSSFSRAMNGKPMRLEGRQGILKRRYLDKAVLDYPDTFLRTITKKRSARSVTHSKNDRHDNICNFPPYCHNGRSPLRATWAGFSANAPFLREEADLVVVIISNSDERKPSKFPLLLPEEVVEQFRNVYESGKRLSVLSLIILPDDKKCLLENTQTHKTGSKTSEGKNIAKLAEQTGGGNFSICLKDYSVLGKTIVQLSEQ